MKSLFLLVTGFFLYYSVVFSLNNNETNPNNLIGENIIKQAPAKKVRMVKQDSLMKKVNKNQAPEVLKTKKDHC